MKLTEDTTEYQIEYAFQFGEWTWFTDEELKTKTIHKLCTDAAILAVRDVLLEQDVTIHDTGISIYSNGNNESILKSITWDRLVSDIVDGGCDPGELAKYARIFQKVAEKFSERVQEAPLDIPSQITPDPAGS